MSNQACHCEEGLPEWIMSYADMITILMAFFVVMYSMAGEKDTKKEQAVMNSLRLWLGGINAPWPNLHSAGGTRPDGTGSGPRSGRSSIPAHVRRPSTAGNVFYFSGAERELTSDERAGIGQSIDSLSGKRHLVEVRGFPSRRPLPTGSPYRDQLELTYDKCRRTRDELVKLGIEKERIQLLLATASAPGGAADDPQLLTHDSRVDVLLLGEFLDPPKAAAAGAAAGPKPAVHP